ncbi:SDR family oxidoreductase [Neisseria weixii]|uniref:SDR family oxidoreductase n=1 Tax=Neisseria weixii TaxID=1853276 RepID=UPI0035A0E99E
MKALIIGANGRVGTTLATVLSRQGHQVFAGARSEKTELQDNGVEAVHFDLSDSVQQMADIFAEHRPDVIYFTAGSRGKNLLQVDAFGAVKAIQAAQSAGIKRFILLSSVFALQPERWHEKFLAELTDYNIAKFFADTYLMNSGLDYTILQPGALQETAGTGKIQTNVREPLANSIENVANTLAALAHADNTIGKVITMADGDEAISQAVAKI